MAGPSKSPKSATPTRSTEAADAPAAKKEEVATGDLKLSPGDEVKPTVTEDGEPAAFVKPHSSPAAPPALVKVRRRSRLSLTYLVPRLALAWLVSAYLLICPSDPSRAPKTCAALRDLHDTLETHSRPYVHTARTKLDPYLKQAQPYIDYTRPYYAKASSAVAPHIENGKKAYYTHAHPKILDALAGAHKSSSAYYDAAWKFTDPHWQTARKSTDPYLKAAQPHIDRYTKLVQDIHKQHVIPQLNFATETAQRGYDAAHAHVHAHVIPAYKNAGPAANKWWRETAQPGARSAYAYSHKTYVGEVHPRLVRAADAVWEFFHARVLPSLKRWHSLYVKPQVDKITARVFEYRAEKAGSQAKTDAKTHSTEKIAEEGFKEDHEGFVAELEKENKEREKEKVEPAAVTRQAKSKEEVAAKRRAIEAARDAYERDLAALIQKERKLFTERLNTLRESATNDIPNRFSAKFTELEREADTLVHRLEKWAERTLVDGSPVEEKISQGKLIGEKAIAKLQRLVNEAKEEVDDFGRAQHAKEQGAVQQAHHPVESLAQEAQSKLGIELTWLDGVTYADWQQYHKLASEASSFREELLAIQQGSRRSAAVARGDFYESLQGLKSDMDQIQSSFVKRLQELAMAGYNILKGEPIPSGTVQDAVERLQKLAKLVTAVSATTVSMSAHPEESGGVKDKLASAAAAAAAGVGAEKVVEALRDTYKSAGDAGGSVAEDVQASLDSVASAAASAFASASQTVSSAIADTTPATSQTASSYAASAAEALSSLTDSASSVLSDASETIVAAVGGTPSPTDLSQSAESVYAKVTDSLPKSARIPPPDSVPVPPVAETFAAGTDGAASIIAEASRSVASALGSTPSSADIAGSASSILAAATDALPEVPEFGDAAHSATRSIKVAAGQTPAASNAGEALENASLAASSVYSQASQVVGDSLPDLGAVPSSASSVLSSAAAAVTGTTPSVNVPDAISSAQDFASSLGGIVSDSVASAVGATPQATNLQQTVETAAAKVTDAAEEAVSRAADAARQAARAARQRIEL